MKRAVVFVVMGGLGLAGAALLGGLNHSQASAAELNGFAINTQDKSKAVTITLFTDQRVPYATEHQGKQFTIVLPNTQISQEQLNNGLPVVVDNKNHFIGRAIPGNDGKVRIILPNLPASDYAVSIQQKHAVAKSTGDSATRPRSATSLSSGNAFEQVVANIPKAHTGPRIAARNTNTDNPGIVRLSPTAHHLIERGQNTRNIIWNPYATKPPKAVVAHEAPSSGKPMPAASEPLHLSHVTPANLPQQLSADPLPQAAFPNQPASPARDNLWYLHSLPPANPNAIPTADLKTLAAQDAQLQTANKPAPTDIPKKVAAAQPQPSYVHGLLKEIKTSFKSIPPWLLITLAIFMGGVGVFTLIGGLVLLKILFVQARTQAFTQPLAAPGDANRSAHADDRPEKSPYATNPAHLRGNRYDFEDKASISALDYLKGSPDSVTAAVHNATLLKFPTHRKHRSGLKKPFTPPKGSAPAYKVSP